MKLLAIETTTRNLGLAIADDDSIVAEYKGDTQLRHSQDLIPNIDALLRKIGSRLADIDCLAISIGPGSFTGLRVGVSIAKGINFVTKIPIVAIPTLDVIAHNAVGSPLPISVIVDAKKKNLYTSLYRAQNGGIIKLWGYLLVSVEELISRIDGETFFVGDGVALYGERITSRLDGAKLAEREHWFPDVAIVARLGIEKFKKGETEDPDALVPLYLYSRECNIKGVYR